MDAIDVSTNGFVAIIFLRKNKFLLDLKSYFIHITGTESNH